MKQKIGKYNLEFYESIDVLPMQRFNAFNKYVMLDAELGATVFDFDKIITRVIEFVDKDMKVEAQKELLNIRIVYNNILNHNDVRGLAFASLIRAINGKEIEDFSQASLNDILIKLSKEGLNNVKIHEINSEVKKN
tara:strand:- start:6176 stop:6583 length:408 start_codon:yes stop_codon:yes gene_type:complete